MFVLFFDGYISRVTKLSSPFSKINSVLSFFPKDVIFALYYWKFGNNLNMQKRRMTKLWLKQWSILQPFKKRIFKTLRPHRKLAIVWRKMGKRKIEKSLYALLITRSKDDAWWLLKIVLLGRCKYWLTFMSSLNCEFFEGGIDLSKLMHMGRSFRQSQLPFSLDKWLCENRLIHQFNKPLAS